MNRSEEEKKQIIPDQTRSGGWVDLACDGQATRSLVVALSGTVAGGLRLLRSCPGRDWICSGGHTGAARLGLAWVELFEGWLLTERQIPRTLEMNEPV
jgi:hypothetical protein